MIEHDCMLSSRVLETRTTVDGTYRRRRECLTCSTRFTTYEICEFELNLEDITA